MIILKSDADSWFPVTFASSPLARILLYLAAFNIKVLKDLSYAMLVSSYMIDLKEQIELLDKKWILFRMKHFTSTSPDAE